MPSDSDHPKAPVENGRAALRRDRVRPQAAFWPAQRLDRTLSLPVAHGRCLFAAAHVAARMHRAG